MGTTTTATTTMTANSTPTKATTTTTKYRIEMDLLISREVHKFQRVDQWNFAAPACSINLHGDAVVEEYPADNFCAKTKSKSNSNSNSTTTNSTNSNLNFRGLTFGGGSAFHQIPEDNDAPYHRTTVHVLAPSGGKMVWAQSHLHTGGINATLYKNGKSICTTRATYGTTSFHNANVNTTTVNNTTTNVNTTNANTTPTNARDEQNHLVRISSCYDQMMMNNDGNTNTNNNNTGIVVFDKGDVFTTESYYYAGTDDDRFDPSFRSLAAGEHKNVMSMFFTGVILDGTSKFLTKERTSFNLWNDFVHVAGL